VTLTPLAGGSWRLMERGAVDLETDRTRAP
jgi:hypothetical protein